MRLLLVLLVLVNLIIFFSDTQTEGKTSTEPRDLPGSGEGSELLRSSENPMQNKSFITNASVNLSSGEAVSVAENSAGSEPGRCWRIGPFSDAESMTQGWQNFLALGESGWQQVAEETSLERFQVLLPVSSREQADSFSAVLRQKGFPDQQFLGSEAEGWFLSVGVFDQSVRAENLRKKLSGIGLHAKIRIKQSSDTLFWIERLTDATGVQQHWPKELRDMKPVAAKCIQ